MLIMQLLRVNLTLWTSDSFGNRDTPDDEVAEEFWRYHKARNDSVIVDICQLNLAIHSIRRKKLRQIQRAILSSNDKIHGKMVYIECQKVQASKRLSRLEGIITALETSHALTYLEKLYPTLPDGSKFVLNCSGRAYKDVQTSIKRLKL